MPLTTATEPLRTLSATASYTHSCKKTTVRNRSWEMAMGFEALYAGRGRRNPVWSGKEAHWSLRGLIVKSAEHCGAEYKPLDRYILCWIRALVNLISRSYLSYSYKTMKNRSTENTRHESLYVSVERQCGSCCPSMETQRHDSWKCPGRNERLLLTKIINWSEWPVAVVQVLQHPPPRWIAERQRGAFRMEMVNRRLFKRWLQKKKTYQEATHYATSQRITSAIRQGQSQYHGQQLAPCVICRWV